jgi:hypothetical protein
MTTTWFLILITFTMLPSDGGPVLAQVCHYKTHPEQKWEDRRVYVVPPNYVCPRAFEEAKT